jgi:hypothetical protein
MMGILMIAGRRASGSCKRIQIAPLREWQLRGKKENYDG